ncbi:hypothetical protein C2845_PM09G11060 [Panicum miliaceum]|uniref:Uncharacterized protein n=1 Tax=Panicum miliaceum TaxID=4540 RepID=A0A3L6S023_PANMI|nr:hypothetical protein C2845_PM09G11060 [Panicum miliaceum]
MLLRFANLAERELVRGLSPIRYEDGELSLECPEETPNRFFREPEWLVYIAVLDFPTEHWFEDHVKRSFAGFEDIVKVASICFTGYDYSPLRVVIAINNRLDIPSELWISVPNGLGGVAQLMPIRIWPRRAQIGPNGSSPLLRADSNWAQQWRAAAPSCWAKQWWAQQRWWAGSRLHRHQRW